MQAERVAIYPGTFDPITNGHFDIINRASKLFDRIVIAVAKSSDKNPMFGHDERINMAKIATTEIENVEVEGFSSLLVQFAHEKNSNIIIRGLRAVSDFEYELQIGYANSSLAPSIETVLLMPSLSNAFISASVVRSIIKHNGKVDHLVPEVITERLRELHCI